MSKGLFSSSRDLTSSLIQESKNSFLQIAVVEEVDDREGLITVTLASGKGLTLPYKVSIQSTGAIDVTQPAVGDIIEVYQDSIIKGKHFDFYQGPFLGVFQDYEVTDNLGIEEKLLDPYLFQGDYYKKSGFGSSLLLSRDINLRTPMGSYLKLNNTEDSLESEITNSKFDFFDSQIRMGGQKRYNPDENPFYESLILDSESDYTSEVTFYLGRKLTGSLESNENYLSGSNEDPNYTEHDLSIGKEDEPGVTFSLTPGDVIDINGEFKPVLNGSPLNFLLSIHDYFTFKVNSLGSFVLGDGSNGIFMDNSDENPILRMGLNRGNQFILHKTGLASMENLEGYYKVFPDGKLNFGNKAFQFIANPVEGEESFQMMLGTDPAAFIKANSESLIFSGGDVTQTWKDGNFQIVGKKISLGNTNYEPALKGISTMDFIKSLLDDISTIIDTLTVPANIITNTGVGSLNPATVAALTLIKTKFNTVYKLKDLSETISPLVSTQVDIG